MIFILKEITYLKKTKIHLLDNMIYFNPQNIKIYQTLNFKLINHKNLIHILITNILLDLYFIKNSHYFLQIIFIPIDEYIIL